MCPCSGCCLIVVMRLGIRAEPQLASRTEMPGPFMETCCAACLRSTLQAKLNAAAIRGNVAEAKLRWRMLFLHHHRDLLVCSYWGSGQNTRELYRDSTGSL